MTERKLTIGILAQVAGVGVETIRFYERKGLIQQPTQQVGPYRQYQDDDVRKIRFIKRAQELGFTLNQILELLELNTNPKATCSHIKKRAESKALEIEAKIRDLQKMRRALKEVECACDESKQAVRECRILDCFENSWKC